MKFDYIRRGWSTNNAQHQNFVFVVFVLMIIWHAILCRQRHICFCKSSVFVLWQRARKGNLKEKQSELHIEWFAFGHYLLLLLLLLSIFPKSSLTSSVKGLQNRLGFEMNHINFDIISCSFKMRISNAKCNFNWKILKWLTAEPKAACDTSLVCLNLSYNQIIYTYYLAFWTNPIFPTPFKFQHINCCLPTYWNLKY